MIRKLFFSSLFTDSSLYLISNILSAAIPFAILPVLTRYLTPAEYGQIAIFQTLLTGVGAFIGISAHSIAGVKYYDNNLTKQEQRIFIGSCFIILAATSAISLLIILIFKQQLSNLLKIEDRWLVLSVFVVTASFIANMRLSQWQVRKQAVKYGIFLISQSIMNFTLSLIFIVYFLQGADGRILVICLSAFVFAIIAVALLIKDKLISLSWQLDHIREIANFGIPLIPHVMGNFLLLAVDRFVINEKLGMEEVGIYMVAVQITSILALLFDSFHNAYVPWLYEKISLNSISLNQKLVKWTYLYFIGLLALAGLSFYVAPPVLVLIAGDNYQPAADFIGWLVLGQIFSGMYLMVTAYVFFSKKTGLLSVSTLTSGLINLGLMIVLINIMDVKGAAIAFSISMAIKFLLTWYVAQLRHPMPWFNFRTVS